MSTETISKKIWLSSPHMSGREEVYLRQALADNWIAPIGPHVDAFEASVQAYTGVQHAAALVSGTAAIHLALILLGVGPSDEVLVQSFTSCGTTNPILYQGAKPVLIDSEADTWNMDPALLQQAIEDRLHRGTKPAAILYVHLYGTPAKAGAIQALGRRYGIPVIEDAAEALGSSYRETPCGSLGDLSIISFNGNKIITTSGGGVLLAQRQDWVEKARFLATQARDEAPHYQHSQLGYNYRLSGICAAIGRGQMEVLDERVAQRRANHQFYQRRLEHLPGVRFLPEPTDTFCNRWLTCLLVAPEASGGVSREDLRQALTAENIDARPLWKPMHLQPIYQGYPFYDQGVSDRLFDIGLCLPSGSNLTQHELERVAGVVERCFG
jgi:dTDP-4-amino-4,6-dideoxygalactose transaminase